MSPPLRRREFIRLLGGAAAAWPLAAGAQQDGRVRRVGVLAGSVAADPRVQSALAAFRERLARLGWSEGRNIAIDILFAPPGERREAMLAKELVGRQPDVIFAHSTIVTAALQRESRTLPIVFASVSDPIGSGFVTSLARPGGNLTGFLLFEQSVAGKWLGMLKEIAPHLVRVAAVINPNNGAYAYWRRAVEAIAPSVGIEVVLMHIESAVDITRLIESFASAPNGGLMILPDNTSIVHLELIAALAARHRLPAVNNIREGAEIGGLMSYDIDRIEMNRQAATYVDRILRGEKPADLPVQAPVKYETVLNLKAAKALGLTVPDLLLVRADEVIE